MILYTDRLIIRSFTEQDIPEYAAIVKDPDVTKFLGDGSHHTYEQADRYVHECMESEIKNNFSRYAVIYKQTNKLIGFCGFKEIDNRIDFGWRYSKDMWGKGYATEAAKAVFDHGIKTLKLSGIIAVSAVLNTRSIKVIEKIGFKFEAFGQLNGFTIKRYKYAKNA
jgi:[ribosomal protein S5]-alanine N-acetyltransferase